MDPSRYHAATAWMLLAGAWVALLWVDAPAPALKGLAVMTAVAVLVAWMHRRG